MASVIQAAVANSRSAAGIGVRAVGITRVFESGLAALSDINLAVAPGEFLAILGPSGCGKSTLMRLIAGLDSPQSGSISLDRPISDPASDARSALSYVFQDAHLLPWRNVLSNVALPLELRGADRYVRREAAMRALALVGLDEAARQFPNQLSGGMKMRVSLARAMVNEPRLLLLDEPFAALDEITRHRLDEQLRELWAARRMTVIFVTHSTTEAVYLAERAVVMSRRPGRIVEDRRIDLPADRDAAVRATPGFARETRFIFEALERGGA